MREITNANATWKTIRLSVNCPYCGTGYTFKKEEKFKEWVAGGRAAPLHSACKQAANTDQVVRDILPSKEQDIK
jgi:hypothetical protein